MSRKCFRYQFISILIRLTNQSFHIETARMVEHFQITFHSEFQTA